MSQYTEGSTKTFTAGAAIAQHLRVKITSGKLAVAGLGEGCLGTLEAASFNDGDKRAVRPWNSQGTRKVVGAGAVAAFALIYDAAGGKVDDVANGKLLGLALEAIGAADEVFELLPTGMFAVDASATIVDAVVAHDINSTFSDTEVEATLDALGVKINAIIAALDAHGLTKTA